VRATSIPQAHVTNKYERSQLDDPVAQAREIFPSRARKTPTLDKVADE
jgi:hypothetical protein